MLGKSAEINSAGAMIRGGFLAPDERQALRALARDGRREVRKTRRANAIVLLDKGWRRQEVSAALLIDDDTVRSWYRLYERYGITGLVMFDVGDSQSSFSMEQEAGLFEWVHITVPRSARAIGAWSASTCDIEYSHAGLIALLRRIGLDYCKPKLVSYAQLLRTWLAKIENASRHNAFWPIARISIRSSDHGANARYPHTQPIAPDHLRLRRRSFGLSYQGTPWKMVVFLR